MNVAVKKQQGDYKYISMRSRDSNEIIKIGPFSPETKSILDRALIDPNNVESKYLIQLSLELINLAIEKYAFQIALLYFSIMEREEKKTLLEALLNNCNEWLLQRQNTLSELQEDMKQQSEYELSNFMVFLREMFFKLKEHQHRLDTKCFPDLAPDVVLLNLLYKCCSECVMLQSQTSFHIKTLFDAFTKIGQDMQLHLPAQFEILLALIRDAFLNANSAYSIKRTTLLLLIELQASGWQLPRSTVMFYYPCSN